MALAAVHSKVVVLLLFHWLPLFAEVLCLVLVLLCSVKCTMYDSYRAK